MGEIKLEKDSFFFDEIERGDYDCVVTYGSSHSNHCRIISNMAAERNMPCIIIGPEEVSDTTFNSIFMRMFGAEIITVSLDKVHDIIEEKLDELKKSGKKPYFIPGGGHGNIGTESYVRAYEEIREYERESKIHFDYIFLASGTGTTHAGLVCGQIKNNDIRKIVGISIARKNPRGRNIVIESVKEYMPGLTNSVIQDNVIFLDDYIGGGYGIDDQEVEDIIKSTIINYGIPLDSTYTGKAFLGMKKQIKKENIKNKNILFIHTGGTPLFFDDLN